MITSKQCFARYGDPVKEKNMVVWAIPVDLQIDMIPKRIYCNNDLILPLTRAFKNIKDRKLTTQIQSWDGCFNIRNKRGAASASIHSWGLAIDINAAWNGFGKVPTMSKELVQCFKDAGFDWGGDWVKKDGMHMQLADLPS